MWIVIGKNNKDLITDKINIYKYMCTNYNKLFDVVLHVEKTCSKKVFFLSLPLLGPGSPQSPPLFSRDVDHSQCLI